MTRSWNAGLMTMMSADVLTPCFLGAFTPAGGAPVYLTSHDQDLTAGGTLFSHDGGFNVSEISVRNGGDPAGLDIEIPISDEGPIYPSHVRRGVWRGATATIWLTDFNNPDNREVMVDGWVGFASYNNRIRASLQVVTKGERMGDIVLQRVQTKCSFVFGGDRCGVNLADFTSTGSVTSVTDNSTFIGSVVPLSPVRDFTHGKLTFTSGNNAGFSRWVRQWTVGSGLIELTDNFPLDVAASDTFTISAGCQQDRADCDSFGNRDRFPGFEFVSDQ